MSTQNNTHNKEQLLLPGRLGDPQRDWRTDPRVDPFMIAALAQCGLDDAATPPSVNVDSPLEERRDFFAKIEREHEVRFKALNSDLPPVENVERRSEVIKGLDGNDIRLYIHQPKNASGPHPCVYHIHGGGMCFLEAAGASYTRWRDELSAVGMVVVGVEFRNGAGKLGNHPFPAGLNDCMSGLEWVYENRATLGISKMIVSGESGGGNLALAVGLKAKQDGKLAQIDGIYALCPFISNAWGQPPKELPSLYENEGYSNIWCSQMAVNASLYDPEHQNDNNPLCWPYRAQREDLQGLPPHVISVNELDALRDEGLKYYQMLRAAGVSGYSRTVNGTCHGSDLGFPQALPEVHAATLRDIKGFADSL